MISLFCDVTLVFEDWGNRVVCDSCEERRRGLADYWCRSFSSFPFDWCVLLKFWFVLSSSNRFVAELVVCFVLGGVSFGEIACCVKIAVSLLSLLTCLGIVEVVVIGSWTRVVGVGLWSRALCCDGQVALRWCPVFSDRVPGYSSNY